MARTVANRRRSYDRIEVPEKEYPDYAVCDPEGRRIGRVKELYTNARGEPEYIKAKVGLFELRCVLIPTGFVTVEERRTITLN